VIKTKIKLRLRISSVVRKEFMIAKYEVDSMSNIA